MTTRSAIRYARNGDVSIAYMESGSGLDLLVIAGFVSHLEIFPTLPAAQRFWDRMGSFARVILFDKRGMGLSDRDAGAYTLENVVDDALAVLDALDVPKSAIFGISEGGSAATMLAAAHPDRKCDGPVRHLCPSRPSDDHPEGIPDNSQQIRIPQAELVAGHPPNLRPQPARKAKLPEGPPLPGEVPAAA